ncbi:hypothetical protein PVAP13_9KG104220 [Panicum virgatum]|uniref:Uncharacterized protein n=1 Tax=Panicum virgatum TaxID=38727 RepID=A0A8T0NKV5_PANVG|nr:hypothetical protein PVAP13_9KG104220 [Panicum virgatum]
MLFLFLRIFENEWKMTNYPCHLKRSQLLASVLLHRVVVLCLAPAPVSGGSCRRRAGSCYRPSGPSRLLLFWFVRHRGLSRSHPTVGALGAFCRPAMPPRLLLLLGPAAACSCRRAGHHFGRWVAELSTAALLVSDGAVVPAWSEFAREAAAASWRLPPSYAKDNQKNFTLFNRSSVSYSEAHARSFGVHPRQCSR